MNKYHYKVCVKGKIHKNDGSYVQCCDCGDDFCPNTSLQHDPKHDKYYDDLENAENLSFYTKLKLLEKEND